MYMKMISICSLVLVVFTLDYAVGTDCPNNWSAHDGSCYFFSRDQKSWTAAWVVCRALESHLVEIDDSSEDNFIWQNVRGYQAWIGLTDIEEEGKYMWMTSHADVTYKHWSIGQPNHISSDENCVVVNSRSSGLGQGWSDKTCSEGHHYVCEKLAGETLIVG